VVRSPERKSRVSFENAFKGLLRRITVISNSAKMEKAKITVLLYGHWNLLRKKKISSTLKKNKCQSPAKIQQSHTISQASNIDRSRKRVLEKV